MRRLRRLDELLQRPEVALPHEPQHAAADQTAHRATHPPREHEALFPGETGAISSLRGEREPALARDQSAVTDAHRPSRLPLGDLHAIREMKGPDPRLAVERRAETGSLIGREPDGLGVHHPVDVTFDVADHVPDGGRWRIDHGADLNASHGRRA